MFNNSNNYYSNNIIIKEERRIRISTTRYRVPFSTFVHKLYLFAKYRIVSHLISVICMYACFVYTCVIKKKRSRVKKEMKKKGASRNVASLPLLPLLVDLLKNYHFVTYYGFDDPNFKSRHCFLDFSLSFSPPFCFSIKYASNCPLAISL